MHNTGTYNPPPPPPPPNVLRSIRSPPDTWGRYVYIQLIGARRTLYVREIKAGVTQQRPRGMPLGGVE